MTGIGRTPRVGRVLAAGALLGLVGCQQLPSRPAASPAMSWNAPQADGPITPAQEADLQISMGRAAEQQGDLEQAMAAYRAALGRDKRRADAYARLAVLHDKQGKFRESAELYRKALAMRPGDPDIFCDMGYSLYLQRRWAEAEMNLRQAIALNPDHRRAHNNLALLLVRDNRLDDALAEFRKGGSDPAQAHINLAFALTLEQRWESARAEYQRALARDPSSQLARTRLDQLNALLAKLEPARAGAAHDPGVVATSNAPLPWRHDIPPAAVPTPVAPAKAPRNPRPVTTVANPPAPRRQPAAAPVAVLLPPLPAEEHAMRNLWAAADSARDTPPRRRAVAKPTAPTASPQPLGAAARSKDAPSRPVSPADTRTAARSRSTKGPKRPIPPPRQFQSGQPPVVGDQKNPESRPGVGGQKNPE